MNVLNEIQRRANYINGAPFRREGLRLGKLLEEVALLAREGAIMAGGPGFDERLIEVAANAVAWVDARRAQREQGQIQQHESRHARGLGSPPGGPISEMHHQGGSHE